MKLFPAIDLYDGKAVRLYKGDYAQMTVYQEDPTQVARAFQRASAACMHLVDLAGAKTGQTPNLKTVEAIRKAVDLFIQVGGGVRTVQTVEKYLSIGIDRVILGTAAVEDPAFLQQALERFGEKIAVGVDLKDGYVATHGWTEKSGIMAHDFFSRMERLGVKTIICTDISRDGAMEGTNRSLYQQLVSKFSIDLIASGGVTDLEDIKALRAMDLYGAIIGKAYYTGAIDLAEALEAAK